MNKKLTPAQEVQYTADFLACQNEDQEIAVCVKYSQWNKVYDIMERRDAEQVARYDGFMEMSLLHRLGGAQ